MTAVPNSKPIVYLLVNLPILCIGGLLVVLLSISTYATMAKVPMSAIPNVNGILISLPTLFLWIPIGFLLSNSIVFVIPPLRKIAERHNSSTKEPTFFKAQRGLLKLAVVFATFCIPLIALGFYL